MILLTVSGFILGGVVTYYFLASAAPDHPRPPWSPRSEMRRDGGAGPSPGQKGAEDPKDIERRAKLVNMWKDRLNLTGEQAEQFHSIFKAGHEKFAVEAEAARARYSQIRKETDEAILKVLDEEQAVKYHEITSEYRARKERERNEERNQGKEDKRD